MLSGTFDRVLRIVKEWRPKKKYRSETGYRDDLMALIRKGLKRESGWGYPSEKHIVQKESGRHLADIGIDEKIGIELKRNLSSRGELQRLIGQVRLFMRSYDYIIVVLCGRTNEEILDELEVQFEDYSAKGIAWGRPETVVEIVKKGNREKKKGPKGWVDIFEEI